VSSEVFDLVYTPMKFDFSYRGQKVPYALVVEVPIGI
jgi:hypothetical protein